MNQRYATDARTAAVFVVACDKAGVQPQWYAHRADLPCGSTIGPITAARLGIPVVDVGAPMLAMHSARELMATADVDALPRRDDVLSERVAGRLIAGACDAACPVEAGLRRTGRPRWRPVSERTRGARGGRS